MSSRYRNTFFENARTQSQVKLRVYDSFLVPWSAMRLSQHRRAWVVDGFAGPGRYRNGHPGSPLVATQRARTLAGSGKQLQCIFGDTRRANVDSLRSIAAEYPEAGVIVLEGDFWSRVADVVSLTKAEPTLVLVDPYGIVGIRFQALADLIHGLPRLDLIVNFRSPATPRLATRHRASVDAAVGSNDWTVETITETFVRNLRSAGDFLRPAALPIRERFGRAVRSELIVAARHPAAYRLWNDQVVLEAERLATGSGEIAPDRDLEIDDVKSRLLQWASGRTRWRRPEAVAWYSVEHCGDAHTGTVGRAARQLLEQEIWIRANRSTKLDEDWLSWGTRPLLPGSTA